MGKTHAVSYVADTNANSQRIINELHEWYYYLYQTKYCCRIA